MRFLRRLGGAIVYLLNVVWEGTQILRSASIEDKGATLRAYLRLTLKHFLSKALRGLRWRRETLFGKPVEFFDYFQLLCMFMTVFVYRDYSFRAENKQPFILDCGSNIGLSMLYFKRQFPESRVIAFEPDPATFGLLKKNAAAYGWNHVELQNRAVFSESGPADFHYDPAEPGSVCMSLRGERMPATMNVETVTLSSFMDGEVDFLKLDVEGAEMAVLGEVARSGKLRQIREMAVEYHHHMTSGEDRFSELLRLLEENGYGYSLHGTPDRPFARGAFEPILVRAYRKAENNA